VGGADKVKRPADDFPNPSSVPYGKLTALFSSVDDEENNNNVWIVNGSFTIIPYIFPHH
jgi:hypothetical protein